MFRFPYPLIAVSVTVVLMLTACAPSATPPTPTATPILPTDVHVEGTAYTANVVEGTVSVNGKPINRATVKLWSADAFQSPPGPGTPHPAPRYLVRGPIATGPEHGGEGAYRFVGVDEGEYYVSVTVEDITVWKAHSVPSKQPAERLSVQVHECLPMSGGDTAILCDLKGSGAVCQIFLAMSTKRGSELVEDATFIKVYVNGSSKPSVSCPVSQFFGYTFEAEPFVSQYFGSPHKHYDPQNSVWNRGAHRYANIPYSSGLRIELEVGEVESPSITDFTLWSEVHYHETAAPIDYGRQTHFKAEYCQDDAVLPYSKKVLADIRGRGRLDSIIFSCQCPDASVIEGDYLIFVDGEEMPSVYSSGGEDFTFNAFYFGQTLVGPYQGVTVCNFGEGVRFTHYRIFELDRLEFDKSLRIEWYAGQEYQGDPVTHPAAIKCSVFYYLDSYPAEMEELPLKLLFEDTFEGYGEDQLIGSPWVQKPGAPQWRQQGGEAVYNSLKEFNAWMYCSKTEGLSNYVVEADVVVKNKGQGEVWVFARGQPPFGFEDRISFGFVFGGASAKHPEISPVAVHVASPTARAATSFAVRLEEVNTLKLRVTGSEVDISVRRHVDERFRSLVRFEQDELQSGYAGLATCWGDVEVHAFRVYGSPITVGATFYPQMDGLPPAALHTPKLGAHSHQDPGVQDTTIRWMRHATLDFVLTSWIARNLFVEGAIDVYRSRPEALPWAVAYEGKMDVDPVSEWRDIDFNAPHPDAPGILRGERFVESMQRLIDLGWIDDPNYFRIDGRPVIMLWGFRHYRNWASWFDQVLQSYEAQGKGRPFFIGDIIIWGDPRLEAGGDLDLARGRVAALISPVLWTQDPNIRTDFFNKLNQRFILWKRECQTRGLMFIPTVHPGFQLVSDPNQVPLPRHEGQTFRHIYQIASAHVDEDMPLIVVVSWNDWGEATEIEPTVEFDTLYLEILREMHTGA